MMQAYFSYVSKDFIIYKYACFLIGLLGAFMGSFCLRIFLNRIRRWHIYTPPVGIPEERWVRAFIIPEAGRRAIQYIGDMEAVIAYISFWLNKPELIGIWLAFKVASKWETWHTIAKLPDTLNNVDELEYFGAKNLVASYTLQRWLIGTLGNILAGFVGVGIARLLIT